MVTRGTRRRLTGGLAALGLVLAGCGEDAATDDDAPETVETEEAAAEADDADADDDAAPAEDDGAEEDAAPDVEPVEGLSITFDGEELAGTNVLCEETGLAGGLIEVDMIEVEIVSPDGVPGAFRAMWDIDAGHMHRVVVTFEPEDMEYETYNVDWREDDVVGDIDFVAESGASGELELKADSELAEAARPDGGTVVFDVDCAV